MVQRPPHISGVGTVGWEDVEGMGGEGRKTLPGGGEGRRGREEPASTRGDCSLGN